MRTYSGNGAYFCEDLKKRNEFVSIRRIMPLSQP